MSAACRTVAKLAAIIWPLAATRVQRNLPVEGRLRTDLAAVSVVPARRSKVPARVIIQAPSHLGLRAAGIEALPEALLAAGFAERSAPAAAPGSLPHPSTPTIDTSTGLLNPHGLVDYALAAGLTP
jgi:hypothetical protein